MKEFCQTRDKLLHALHRVEQDIERLTPLVRDEEDNKNIINSDDETDNHLIDPRYEFDKYKSKKLDKTDTTPAKPTRLGQIPGLHKQNNSMISAHQVKQEEMQRMKLEAKIKAEKERKLTAQTSRDESNVAGVLNRSRQLLKEQQVLARQRYIASLTEPIKSCFETFEQYKSYNEKVQSNKYSVDSEEYQYSTDPGYDIISRKYISARYLPKDFLDEQLKDTHIYRLSRLYEMIPHNSKQLMESNFVVIGLVKKKFKSTISEKGEKFMKIIISDFKYDIVLFLWGDSHDQNWTIRPGTICAILNPEIIDIKSGFKKEAGSTSMLKLESSLTLLQYAKFASFGTCKGLKGQQCEEPIDTSKSRYCPYHMEKVTDKNASNRNEMGSNYKLFVPTDVMGNKQVLMVNDSELEKLELQKTYSETKSNSYSGLAIEQVKPHVNTANTTKGMLLADYANPETQSNMRSKEEIYRKDFKTFQAVKTFLHPGQMNKAAIKAQARSHELDMKLKREQIKKDDSLKRKHDRETEELSYKKTKEIEVNERKKELLMASMSDKTLRKEKAMVQKQVEENARVDREIKEKRLKTLIATNPYVRVQTPRPPEKEIQLSSDSDSDNED